MTSFTITVPSAASLSEVLASTLPFADSDASLPVLCALEITAAADRLEVAATDRHVLGITGTAASVEGDAVPFLVPSKLATALVRSLKTQRHAEITITADVVRGRVGRITVAAPDTGWQESHTLEEIGEFPKVRKLFPEEGTTGPGVSVIGLDPLLLAKFAKVKVSGGARPAARLSLTAERKPVRVDIGEDFRGLIMPCALPAAA